jgi:hypothetical protein
MSQCRCNCITGQRGMVQAAGGARRRRLWLRRHSQVWRGGRAEHPVEGVPDEDRGRKGEEYEREGLREGRKAGCGPVPTPGVAAACFGLCASVLELCGMHRKKSTHPGL